MSRPKPPPKELREIWASIPSIKCQGKCQRSCGPLPVNGVERELVEERAGKKLRATGNDLPCSMLDLRTGRCTVYSIRPTICRLWGVVESMRCPWGCEPERVLSDQEGYALMTRASFNEDAQIAMAEAFAHFTESDWAAVREFVNQGAPDLDPNIELPIFRRAEVAKVLSLE